VKCSVFRPLPVHEVVDVQKPVATVLDEHSRRTATARRSMRRGTTVPSAIAATTTATVTHAPQVRSSANAGTMSSRESRAGRSA
jgi:hypothetical protein